MVVEVVGLRKHFYTNIIEHPLIPRLHLYLEPLATGRGRLKTDSIVRGKWAYQELMGREDHPMYGQEIENTQALLCYALIHADVKRSRCIENSDAVST